MLGSWHYICRLELWCYGWFGVFWNNWNQSLRWFWCQMYKTYWVQLWRRDMFVWYMVAGWESIGYWRSRICFIHVQLCPGKDSLLSSVDLDIIIIYRRKYEHQNSYFRYFVDLLEIVNPLFFCLFNNWVIRIFFKHNRLYLKIEGGEK